MTTFLTNRVQSAYARPSYRSGADNHDAQTKRPTTSMGTRQPYTNEFDQAAMNILETPNLSPPPGRRPRPKTASISTTASTRAASSRKLRSDEIDSLLRSLDRDDAFIVKVDCLADYRTLVQTIDLRKTPLDCQLLCALQQRENRIVQHNARHDIRFRSLIEVLEPQHERADNEHHKANDGNRTPVSEYPPSNFIYEYMK